jgi:hypothetical protein
MPYGLRRSLGGILTAQSRRQVAIESASLACTTYGCDHTGMLSADADGRGCSWGAKFGPDVEWLDAIDYDVDPRWAPSFYAAIRSYWPDLPEGALQPGYAGIRPGGSTTDFLL